MGLLSAAAFDLVPADQLLSRELHAKDWIGIEDEKVPALVGSCTDYTAKADRMLAGMAADVANIHLIMFGAVLPTAAALKAVDELLVGWADQALELGRTWVRHRMNALETLDADQVRKVSAVHAEVTVLLTNAVRQSMPRQTAGV
ncbi:hypothetical protein MXD61_26785 [Frankia sp. AgPm24]|nr:hypothetical protein [Frankia sp. AgPm24]